MFSKLWLTFLYLLFLWNYSCAYDDFCDEQHVNIYCTCDTRYMETKMMCFINGYLKKDDTIWNDMSKVDNVITLRISPRVPMRFEEIPIDSLKLMPFLEILIIQQGSLGDLQSYAIAELKILRELELDSCEITGLQSHAISNMPKLKRLSLSDNLLQELLSDSLTELLNLEQLFLDRNNISRIEGCAFCELQNLRDLELWKNEITDITEHMFRGLRYLKRLDLSRNKIRILNEKVFHSMPKLVELDLNANWINYIAPRAFQGLKKLQSLNLHSNNIKVLPDNVFKSLPRLRSVELYKNDLEAFPVSILEHMDNIKDPHFSINFHDNPLKCDCRLSWVAIYIKLNTSHQFTRELQQLRCTPEGENSTVWIIHSTKLDCTVDPLKSVITTSRSVTDHPADLIPYEIQRRKNKTMSPEPREESLVVSKKNDTTLSDIAEINTIISQDGGIDAVEKIEDGGSSGSSRSMPLCAEVNLIMFVTLLTVFLVRKRKGTLL